jgi:hypothetical protein
MKTQKKPEPSEVKRLLQQAEDFAAVAVSGVVGDIPDDFIPPRRVYRSYIRQILGLEAHFLFPNLAPVHRRVIADLLEEGATSRRRRTLPRWRGARRQTSASSRRSRIDRLRGQASELKKLAVLTPAQRGILDAIVRGIR